MQTIRFRHRLLTLATLAALSGAAFAQAPSPTAGKDALKEPQVRALLTEKGYTKVDDLDFGTIAVSLAQGGSVVVAPADGMGAQYRGSARQAGSPCPGSAGLRP